MKRLLLAPLALAILVASTVSIASAATLQLEVAGLMSFTQSRCASGPLTVSRSSAPPAGGAEIANVDVAGAVGCDGEGRLVQLAVIASDGSARTSTQTVAISGGTFTVVFPAGELPESYDAMGAALTIDGWGFPTTWMPAPAGRL